MLANNFLTACIIVNGDVNVNVNYDIFNNLLEKILILEVLKNSVIIIDNTAFHKSYEAK